MKYKNIATGTESTARAGDYDNPYIFFIAQFCEEVCEFVIDLERDRVQPLGAIEGDGRDAVALFVEKSLRSIHKFISLSLDPLAENNLKVDEL